MLDAFLTTDGLIALVTLTFLEVVLGVDNVIFISILAGKLPEHQQLKARRTGLLAAMIMRILLFCRSHGSSGSPHRFSQSWARTFRAGT
jgi:predicted tellurium resistance membrane protein TerC